MAHRAEIRFPANSPDTSAADPSGIVVNHHRVERAELSLEALSGGHLFHLALAGCIFNNIHRLAGERGIRVTSAIVAADGTFGEEGSLGVSSEIEITGDADEEELRKLAEDANAKSAIRLAIQKGAPVSLAEVRVTSRSDEATAG